MKRCGHPQTVKVESKMRGGIGWTSNVMAGSRGGAGANQSCAGARLQKVALRIISGCAAARQHFTGPLFFFFSFLLLFLGSLNVQGSYLTTIFQADLLTVMYSPQQGLWNKGRAWRKGRGRKNNLAYNQICVNLIVATGLVSPSTHTMLLSQQWYFFVQN